MTIALKISSPIPHDTLRKACPVKVWTISRPVIPPSADDCAMWTHIANSTSTSVFRPRQKFVTWQCGCFVHTAPPLRILLDFVSVRKLARHLRREGAKIAGVLPLLIRPFTPSHGSSSGSRILLSLDLNLPHTVSIGSPQMEARRLLSRAPYDEYVVICIPQ